ncbi:MAG: ABC transporter multidrug efflux pump [Ignavibacteriae bacterium]|nr:MAG: ABC transporter multidrug efflux pump [Ignavibacteriota bacterium]
MNSIAINAKELTKNFNDVIALDNLTLKVNQGEIFSIVGPDGAGKSTFIRICCGILTQTSGELKIFELNWNLHRKEIKSKIGYLSQRFSLYGDLTVDENINFFAEIHNQKNYQNRKEELLEFTRLKKFRNTFAEYLSGGMKQKLALACCLIHNPKLLLLDEPTVGVDPVSRREFWKILSELLKTGMTILMATPYLDEAERCNRIALINRGKILACDVPQKIKQFIKDKIFEVICPDTRTVYHTLLKEDNFLNVQMFGDRLHITTAKDINSQALLNILNKYQVKALSIREIIPSMEDVFIAMTKNQ